MKKAIAIALCMLLVPAAAMAMQPISEAQMDTVTGQSGVSIVLDDIQIYQHMDGQELWYQDTSSDGASVGFVYGTDSYSMIYVNAITPAADAPTGTDFGDVDVQGTYMGGYDFSGTASPLTIDVSDTLAASTTLNGGTGNEIAGVAIGLPTVEIYFAAGARDVMDVAIFTEDTAANTNPLDRAGSTAAEGYHSFGTIYQSPGSQTLAVLDGYVEISPNDAW